MKKFFFYGGYYLFFSSPVFAQQAVNKNDSVYMKKGTVELKPVVVEGVRQLVKVEPGKFTYDVENDLDAQDKSTMDIMYKVPMLVVNGKGEISAEAEKKIVYKLNGLRDPLLSGDVRNPLKAIGAKEVKRIEVITQPDPQYGPNTIVVNFVTKGRLEGYTAVATTNPTDNSWTNIIYGVTKYKKFTVSGNYMNIWDYGHSSTYTTDEYRYNSPDYFHSNKMLKEYGFFRNMHSIEMSASYVLNDNAFISTYGRIILNSNPHENSKEVGTMLRQDGSVNYQYEKNIHHLYNNKEGHIGVSLECRLGKNEELGKFYLNYKYYFRPINSIKTETYEKVDSITMTPGSLDGFYNFRRNNKASQAEHTVASEFWHKLGNKHFVSASLKYIMRPQYDKYFYYTAPLFSHEYSRREDWNSDYDHNQHVLDGYLTYRYAAQRVQALAGLHYSWQSDKLLHSDAGHNFKKQFHNILPLASMSYKVNNGLSLDLSYSMTVLRPGLFALDPYVNRSIPMQLTYGNLHLTPERTNSVLLSSNWRVKRYTVIFSVRQQFTNDIILNYRFLKGDILHITQENLGKKRGTDFYASFSGRPHRYFFLRLMPSLSYTDFQAASIKQKNSGWYFNINASCEWELFGNQYLSFRGNYHTRYVMLQGKGTDGYTYEFGYSKYFLKNKLRVYAYAGAFLPTHYTNTEERITDNYRYLSSNRFYKASFGVNISYTFGKLKARVKRSDKEIYNDDIKNDYDN